MSDPVGTPASGGSPVGDEPLIGAPPAADPPQGVEASRGLDPSPATPTSADAAAIERLVDEILPLLIARFRAGRMGELEVRREGWHVRVRRPADELAPMAGRAATARAADASARGTDAGRRSRTTSAGQTVAAGQTAVAGHASSAHPPGLTSGATTGLSAVGPGRPVDGHGPAAVSASLVATSPGVGYYATRDGIATGSQVRSGDVLAHVDVLGVRQEVVAPGDGIVARLLAEPGEAVEYGQDLVRLEPVSRVDPAREA
jgi:acetyl-CoA carboxylase biotin carboxyl carrier protein